MSEAKTNEMKFIVYFLVFIFSMIAIAFWESLKILILAAFSCYTIFMFFLVMKTAYEMDSSKGKKLTIVFFLLFCGMIYLMIAPVL